MATNRLSMVCSECEEKRPRPSVAMARLAAGGGDWDPPRTEQFRERWLEDKDAAFREFSTDIPRDATPPALGEQIAAFINRHRWCGGGCNVEHIKLEWENRVAATSGAPLPDFSED